MISKEELLKRANKPSEDALRLHRYYRGKVQTAPRCAVTSIDDFAIWYTPGVAEPCKAIQKQKDLVYDYTWKWNTVAVVSDGTRVLGLGNIGPEAAMPVMEGKALLFKYLGGVDAVPICLDTTDPDEFVKTVRYLQPSFGGINLEDIEQPKCFYILERLRQEMTIPVWHDDQQGTAAVTVAGMINAAKVVGKKLGDMKIAIVGAGAASICVARMLIAAGATAGNIILTDTKGTLHKGRKDLEQNKDKFKEKWEMCLKTNAENVTGGVLEAMKGADAVIALSRPGPGTIRKEWVEGMAKDAIVFACANPVPEIWPWEAKEAGAKVVATGRSDFANQVNNSLGFPAIFRGALDVRSKTITDEMCIAAAEALARYVEKKGLLREDHLLPTMDEWEVYPEVAAAVGTKAVEQGVARIELSYDDLYKRAVEMIKSAREMTRLLTECKIIPVVSRD
ncbi:MAG: NADP-dependent malic enzyme [Firmicutes bacterium]|nr:NADP-dependent malic enzyme [Candidatus Fermentithermobacillaceae bacterium]